MTGKLFAEFIGTFTLALTVLLSVSGVFPIPTPILAGVVLGLFVYTVGSISGCHINPGVTIGLLSLKKIETIDAAKYIGAQLLGAIAAIGVVIFVGIKVPTVPTPTPTAYIFETLGMIIFTFGICAVVMDKTKSALAPIIIGGSLFLGISISVMGGGAGILNPAVAVALKTNQIGYYIAEIVGGIVGFQLYTYISSLNKSKS